ncbi:MAG: hypothetical protein IJJ22_03055 [Oscillospiraceae bacterium]|nr:hypothetical protein [Oscillospiraceae bacterium]
MSGRPPKRPETVQGHITKAELESRKNTEKALRTKHTQNMSQEVKADPVATRYYLRLIELYEDIDMNEGFFENCINRYCLLLSEQDRLVKLINKLMKTAAKDLEVLKALNSTERNVATIRNQLLAIEKENLLTVNSKLRAVPKKPEQVEESPLEAFRKRYSS